MECNFVVGQKVVCVDDKDFAPFVVIRGELFLQIGNLDGLTKNNVYTIRSLDKDEFDGNIVVQLVEIIRSITSDETKEPGYLPSRFRPVITTDISVFEAMLAPRVKVDV